MAVGVPSSTNVGGSLSFHAGSTNLLIALGDGGAPNAAQNLSLPLGKILRVDVDTLPPCKAPALLPSGHSRGL